MRKLLSISLAMTMALAVVYAQEKGKGKGKGKGGFFLPPSIQISVEGTKDLGAFPAANAGAQGTSPKISWTGAPANTQSYALLFHDPDPVIGAKASTDVTHWLVYNIPGTATGLPANVPAGDLPDGTKQANNTMGRAAYAGPQPPAGHGPHHYTFELWALDAKIEPAAQDRDSVIKAMDGHVLAKGYFVTTFENK